MRLFGFIDVEKASYLASVLCKVLKASRSGYYGRKKRPPLRRSREEIAPTAKIREIHERSRNNYGSPRLHAELGAIGIRCGRKRVARLMREAGLKGCLSGRKKRTTTTRRDGSTVPAPDLSVVTSLP